MKNTLSFITKILLLTMKTNVCNSDAMSVKYYNKIMTLIS